MNRSLNLNPDLSSVFFGTETKSMYVEWILIDWMKSADHRDINSIDDYWRWHDILEEIESICALSCVVFSDDDYACLSSVWVTHNHPLQDMKLSRESPSWLKHRGDHQAWKK